MVPGMYQMESYLRTRRAVMRINRCTRFRLTRLPSRASQTFMRAARKRVYPGTAGPGVDQVSWTTVQVN